MKSRLAALGRPHVLIYFPVAGLLIAIGLLLVVFYLSEQKGALERAQTQLSVTVATLADANEFALTSAQSSADDSNDSRAQIMWNVLLQYPNARVWVETDGAVTMGEAPKVPLDNYIVAEEHRKHTVVHVAVPNDDALHDVQHDEWVRTIVVSLAEFAIVFLTFLLSRTLKKSAANQAALAKAVVDMRIRDEALEVIRPGIVIYDNRLPGAPVIYANPALAEMFRVPREALIGSSSADAAPEVLAKFAFAKQESPIPGKWSVEMVMKRPDGTEFICCEHGSEMRGPDGELTHTVIVHEDVTEERRRDELVMEAQKMESVGQLTGGIAHDFNNLLTAVRSSAEDLRDDLAEDDYHKEQAEIIIEAANRGAGLVAQLMAFARKQELQPQTVDINAFLDGATPLIRTSLPTSVSINIKKGEGLHNIHVDPARLQTALMNIVLNAGDAMPDGGQLTIETYDKSLDAEYAALNLDVKQGNYVVLAISDTGTGMPAHIVDRAFTPFFTTKEVGKGTGLGLSMVHGFVKQSGGNAKIYSEVGHGTVVRIYLPAQDALAVAASDDTDAADGTPASAAILLVEDDPLVRQTISNKLTSLGHQVVTATSAQEALERLEGNPHFDLVFSDVVMPGTMSGCDLICAIKKKWPQMHVLLSSGYTESAVLGRANIPADVSLLSKPYSNQELVQAIRRAFRDAPRAAA